MTYITVTIWGYSSTNVYDILRSSLGLAPPRFRAHPIYFSLIRKLHPAIKYRIDKLTDSQYYESIGIEEIGFQPQLTLKNIDTSEFQTIESFGE